MSRSGYYDEVEDYWGHICWRGARGQALLADLAVALGKMPVRELVGGELVSPEGCCALGAVAVERGLDVSKLDPEDYDAVAAAFNIAPAMAREIVDLNDDHCDDGQRFDAMRRYALGSLIPRVEGLVSP